MRLALVVPLVLLALSTSALGAGDPFAGTWETRVATGTDTYTLRLACKTRSDCELQRSDTTRSGKPTADTISFKATRPFQPVDRARNALRYALQHQAEGSVNIEFAAIQKLLASAVNAKTDIDACISLDDQQPDHFVACTVRGATSRRPVLLFFGSLFGLCGQGFCKYVVYPLEATGPR
jgi:hypothetical protein